MSGSAMHSGLRPGPSSAVTLDKVGETSDATQSLRLFVRAKRSINELFQEIASYVSSARSFVSSEAVSQSPLLSESEQGEVEQCSTKVANILEVLSRDHMKVVFFGRTSNGKSTAINALLGHKILPTGIGHTTSCFLQVEGNAESSSEAYILTEGQPHVRQSLESVSQLANALSSEQLDASEKIRILWPTNKCPVLAEEAVFIDSPGIDVESDLDQWIDKFCLDSDVFVLVANAESTLMRTEKQFFHKVSERLSRPTLFIVHNRSDAFAGEAASAALVRKQHTERACKFLVDELGVCSDRAEAEERIFFISAKESLEARMQEAKGIRPPVISTEDFYKRYLEFQAFEKSFAACLSQSAVKTKFASHCHRGQEVTQTVAQHMNNLHMRALEAIKSDNEEKNKLLKKVSFTQKNLEDMTLETKDQIYALTEEVETKVNRALNEEIRRLYVLVDEFNEPFHADPLVINVYKSKLNDYIESGVGSNLRSRLSHEFTMNMERQQHEMIEKMTQLLPPERQQVSRTVLPRRGDDFEVLYHLHFNNLCSDFREDLSFRFSLGLNNLMQRFMAQNNGSRRQGLSRHVSQMSPNVGVTPSNELAVPQDDWSLISKMAMATISSQGTMGGLILGGLLVKSIGWRVLLATGTFFGAVYCYERLTWTNVAKCKEFKKQYVEHAARKLRLVVDMTSANCSHQVQQELSSTFARLCHLVDETTNELREEVTKVETRLEQLDKIAGRSKVLRNEAGFIANKMAMFEQTYLHEDE